MSPALQSLYLLVQSKPGKRLDSLRKKLEAAGFRLDVVRLDDADLCTLEWAKAHFKEEPQAILFVDSPHDYVARVSEQLSALGPAFRHIPFFFGYTSADSLVDLEKLTTQIVDFFPLTESSEALRLRFFLRTRQHQEKVSAIRSSQDQASQLAALDTALKQREEFLGVCAHDLRSPIALIQTCLSMILKSPEAMAAINPMFGELLTRAHRQSGHALTLVKDLLDVTAFDQGLRPQYQILRLHDLLSEFVGDYQLQAAQKDVAFRYFNPIQDWKVLADSDRIRQLLQNLFANALKFSEPGKNIYLNVAPFQGRRSHDPDYPMIVISLKDEGKGIPPAEMRKIFDRFVQLKEQSREGGRGLGLTVAKQISTLHDGNIWVESEQGKGATFYVLFPHALSRIGIETKPNPMRRVLVAEASEERRKSLFGKLTQWGYHVDFATDGVEAITLTHHLRPDVVVLTAELGKINTADVANFLKAETELRDIPVLLATPNLKQNQRNETILANGTLPLPFTQSDWEDALSPGRNKLRKVA